MLWFLSSIFFSSRNLISAVGDWMSTILPHMVFFCVNLECRSQTCCLRLAENAARKKSPKSRHLGTIPQLYRVISSQLRQVSTIGNKLVKHQYLPHMSPQYGELRPLAAEIDPVVWGTPAKFNGFRVLAALLHGTRVWALATLRH